MKVEMIGNNSKEEIEKRVQTVASAGNLSRADGTVTQVIESNNDYEKNLKLAKAIVKCGHKSIAEHDYVVFALEDVTPIIEQIMIGYRLTSFTIKSRRNVDFRNAGFYTPEFRDKEGNQHPRNEKLKEVYNKYMKELFKKYGELEDQGLPIEDCRYILPYCFHSNIIMGCDAHELLNMTSDLLYGEMSQIKEAHDLGEKLAEMFKNYIPYLEPSLKKEAEKTIYRDHIGEVLKDKGKKPIGHLLKEVDMYEYTENADDKVLQSIFMEKYQLTNEQSQKLLDELEKEDPKIKSKLMNAILHNKNQRELVQVNYSFQFPISLAALTHITRHRMHSLMYPNPTDIQLDDYIVPKSLEKEHRDEIDDIFVTNKLMKEAFEKQGVNEYDLVYFLLAGNACNATTRMNARTAEWISRLRCCDKAQWEIRDIANQMSDKIREVSPLIGNCLGPTCKVFGTCEEGKDSCKRRGIVYLKKKEDNEHKN